VLSYTFAVIACEQSPGYRWATHRGNQERR
jgi:hypothetical protein